ncbi:hypothetical protein BLNAU_16702 [Blattamonas nauphoetae]|uniref:Uncharacterized protein n=1 Tax=Blattamonas nauphoetae TaxID=2049346 RepID=A0ABQ9XDH6_9EUKA|nr:hypothetical protein BLNAU_16702 [Blattamonas nauphoetae]
MPPDPSVNHDIDSLTGTNPSADIVSFFTECLTQFKNGDEKAKIDVAICVHSKILSDKMRIGEMSSYSVSSGLLEELCCTLSEPCPDQLFVCVTSLVSLVVSGASLPVRGRVSSLLPSLLGLITKMENGIGEAATRAIGFVSSSLHSLSLSSLFPSGLVVHLCSVCLSSNDVDGILNNGIVEGLCSQCMTLISSARRTGSCHAQTVTLLRGLDSFCTGLAEFISSEKEKKEKEKRRKENEQEEALENEDESEFSLLSRSSSALSLIESTLGEMLNELQRQKQPAELDLPGKELRKEVASILVEQFPDAIVTRREKKAGVIGLDVGTEIQRMETQLWMKMSEVDDERQNLEEQHQVRMGELEDERMRMDEQFRIKMSEMENEWLKLGEQLRTKMSEMDDERQSLEEQLRMKTREMEAERQKMDAEREMYKQLIAQGRKGVEQEQRQQEDENKRRTRVKIGAETVKRSLIGAEVIELFDQAQWTVSGSVFTKSKPGAASLVSFEFGEDVARLSLTIGKGPNDSFAVGIVSSELSKYGPIKYFLNMKGGAGWNLTPNGRFAKQKGKEMNKGEACMAMAGGQRVVLEADGREGLRTLRLSQDGETQPVFFTNIPVPFQFAVYIYGEQDSVEIESVEVMDEPQMVGGTIPVEMDE